MTTDLSALVEAPPDRAPDATGRLPQLTCPSTIDRVTIHARGAIVTRRVELPEALPDGLVEIVIVGISALVEPASVGVAVIGGGREVELVTGDLTLPEDATSRAAEVADRDALIRARDLIHAQLDALATTRKRLAAAAPAPDDDEAWRDHGPLAHIQRALGLSGLLDDQLASIDAQRAELEAQRDALTRKLTAATLTTAQLSSEVAAGAARVTWTARARLSGEGAPEALEVSYVVPNARWWPIYTLFLADQGADVRLRVEALVAQDTGEDWSSVTLRLATSDLLHDARLPELPALRLGKPRRPKPSGYREAPDGLGRLFDPYDSATPRVITGQDEDTRATLKTETFEEPQELEESGSVWDEIAASASFHDDDLDDMRAPMPQAAAMPVMMRQESAKRGGSLFGAVAEAAAGVAFGAAEAMADRAPSPKKRAMSRSYDAPMHAPMHAPMPAPSAPGGGGGRLAREQAVMPHDDGDITPQEDWLDFDQLRMAGPAHTRRGQLVRREASARAGKRAHDMSEAASRATSAFQAQDPMLTRGSFDHQYTCDGRMELPADGKLHRLDVQEARGEAKLWLRTVPVELEEVFRMARITNPHDAPLLAGPVDVFVEGSFVTTSQLDRVDRGGEFIVGLGVEDRVRVARNVRVHESSEGLLVKDTHVDHTVTIELSSSLGAEALVEVLERVPIPNDRDSVKVEITGEEPAAKLYTQKEHQQRVEGGRRWRKKLGPGEQKTLTLAYRITFSNKEELVGGNQRD